MATVMNIAEIDARVDEIKARLAELDAEFAGTRMSDEAKTEWNDLNEERVERLETRKELVARSELIEGLSNDERRTESGDDRTQYRRGLPKLPENIHDVAEYRASTSTEEQFSNLLRDGASKVVEGMTFGHPGADREKAQDHVERLLNTIDGKDRELARRIITTSSPVYRRAFGKKWAGEGLNAEEERTLNLGTTAGGFAVPVALDPSVIPTSNGTVNPLRAIGRVIQITGSTWKGVTSPGITASYAAEGTEASDNAPVLAQPQADPERAQVFIPFSIEIGGDWSALESEMAQLVQDAKDDLEANKFVHGLGHTTFNQPEGLLVGGTAIVSTVAATALAAADVYALEEALPPRFRPRARIVGNRKQYNRVRQIDTQGGGQMWIRIGDGLRNSEDGALGEALLGYPTYESSEMVSTLTSASSILTIGDFSYFVIVDRVGMNAEVVPHLFGSSNRYPTGQRGLYFWWRNTSDVTHFNAFRTLKVT